MNNNPYVPTPNRLLEQTAAPASSSKVFFGALQASGKAWAMLAQAPATAGARAGYCGWRGQKPMGEKLPAAMLEGLAVLPPKRQACVGGISASLISMPPSASRPRR
ncbi:osmosensitive K+ channel His kinase sensor domain protein [Shigella flexneri]